MITGTSLNTGFSCDIFHRSKSASEHVNEREGRGFHEKKVSVRERQQQRERRAEGYGVKEKDQLQRMVIWGT